MLSALEKILTDNLCNPFLVTKMEFFQDLKEDVRRFTYSKITRPVKYFYQRRTRGWDDSDIWSLDYTFAEWIVPRLKKLRDVKHGRMTSAAFYKGKDDNMDDDVAWKKANDLQYKTYTEMIEGFELLAINQDDNDREVRKKVNRSLDLFRKHFFSLWT